MQSLQNTDAGPNGFFGREVRRSNGEHCGGNGMNGAAILLVPVEDSGETVPKTLPLPRITRMQYSYLKVIGQHPGICANRAGRVLGRKNSTSYDTVKALLRMNLVSRQVDPFLSSPTGYPLFVTSTGSHLLSVLQGADL